MSKKSLDRILSDVDEREESPDDEAFTGKPEKVAAKEEPDIEPDEAAEPKGEVAKDDTPDEGDDKKDGLPPWMHARIKAATDKSTAAEKRAAEAEARAKALEESRQNDAPEETLESYLSQMKQAQDRQTKNTQIAVSKRLAAAEYGAEEVDRAMAWAQDVCDANPQFNQMMWDSPEPAFDAVKEFRKAQTLSELDQYGGDINKLIEARMAAQGGVQTDQAQSQQAPQGKPKLPGNFATSNNSGGSRSGAAWSGPKPLGDLLKS